MKKALLESLQGSIHSFSSSKSHVFVKKALNLGSDRESTDIGISVDGEGLFLLNIDEKRISDCVSFPPDTRFHCSLAVSVDRSAAGAEVGQGVVRFWYCSSSGKKSSKNGSCCRSILKSVIVGSTLNDHKFEQVPDCCFEAPISSISAVDAGKLVIVLECGDMFLYDIDNKKVQNVFKAETSSFHVEFEKLSSDLFVQYLRVNGGKSLAIRILDDSFVQVNYQEITLSSSKIICRGFFQAADSAVEKESSFRIIVCEEGNVLVLSSKDSGSALVETAKIDLSIIRATAPPCDIQFLNKDRIAVLDASGRTFMFDLKFKVCLTETQADQTKDPEGQMVVFPDLLVTKMAGKVFGILYEAPKSTLASVIQARNYSSIQAVVSSNLQLKDQALHLHSTIDHEKITENWVTDLQGILSNKEAILTCDFGCSMFDLLVSKLKKCSDKEEGEESVLICSALEGLLVSGLVLDWKCSESIAWLIQANLCLEPLVRCVKDIREATLVKVLNQTFLKHGTNIEDESLQFKLMSMIVSRTFADRLVLCRLVKTNLGSDETLACLDLLVTWLTRHTCEICPDRPVSSIPANQNDSSPYPNLKQTLAWIKVIMDSKYSSLVLDDRFAPSVKKLAAIVKREIIAISQVGNLFCQLKELIANGASTLALSKSKRAISADYSVEYVDI